jgi:hypothetical protein
MIWIIYVDCIRISKILLIASLKTFLTSLHLRQNSFLDTIHYTFKHRLLLIDIQYYCKFASNVTLNYWAMFYTLKDMDLLPLFATTITTCYRILYIGLVSCENLNPNTVYVKKRFHHRFKSWSLLKPFEW